MKKDRFTDENDVFERMLNHIRKNEFFRGRSVWIDSFTGFTSKEFELITLMLRQCRKVTVTLCTDLRGEPAFECTDNTFRRLKDLAERNGIPCSVVNLSADPESNRSKYGNSSLFYLEQAPQRNDPRSRLRLQSVMARTTKSSAAPGRSEDSMIPVRQNIAISP